MVLFHALMQRVHRLYVIVFLMMNIRCLKHVEEKKN